ncbi:MAG TPA: CvpA family protein [Planctomycetaceae bacterium]|nr:CvpA family protein [Planctomycetaceae bacterium]
MIDMILLAILAAVTWFVASEGAWTAGTTFVCVLVSALLAMNFFEPLTLILARSLPDHDARMDMIALVGLVAVFVFLSRLAAERMAPTYVQVPGMVDNVGRWGFAAGTGYLTMAFLLTALHTTPLPREFLGFKPERANFFGMAPDRQWLGFTQYVTEKAFARYDVALQMGAPMGTPHAFDGQYMAVGDAAKPYPNLIWASFPIRYATRRSQFSNGGIVTMQPTAPVRPAPAPSPGGGTPAGGGGSVGF